MSAGDPARAVAAGRATTGSGRVELVLGLGGLRDERGGSAGAGRRLAPLPCRAGSGAGRAPAARRRPPACSTCRFSCSPTSSAMIDSSAGNSTTSSSPSTSATVFASMCASGALLRRTSWTTLGQSRFSRARSSDPGGRLRRRACTSHRARSGRRWSARSGRTPRGGAGSAAAAGTARRLRAAVSRGSAAATAAACDDAGAESSRRRRPAAGRQVADRGFERLDALGERGQRHLAPGRAHAHERDLEREARVGGPASLLGELARAGPCSGSAARVRTRRPASRVARGPRRSRPRCRRSRPRLAETNRSRKCIGQLVDELARVDAGLHDPGDEREAGRRRRGARCRRRSRTAARCPRRRAGPRRPRA